MKPMEINKKIFDVSKFRPTKLNYSNLVLDALMEASLTNKEVVITVASLEAEVLINQALDSLAAAGDDRVLQIIVERVLPS